MWGPEYAMLCMKETVRVMCPHGSVVIDKIANGGLEYLSVHYGEVRSLDQTSTKSRSTEDFRGNSTTEVPSKPFGRARLERNDNGTDTAIVRLPSFVSKHDANAATFATMDQRRVWGRGLLPALPGGSMVLRHGASRSSSWRRNRSERKQPIRPIEWQ